MDLDRVIWDGEETGHHLEVEALVEDVDFLLDALRFVVVLVEDLEVHHQDEEEVHQGE